MTDNCLFCRIAARTIPSHVVHEDEQLLAFLDIHPMRPGHTLIVTKPHHRYFDEAPPALTAAITHLGQRLAGAMKRIYDVPRVGLMFNGADVAHVHAHVVPMREAADLTSRQYIAEQQITFRPPPRASDAELAAAAATLAREL